MLPILVQWLPRDGLNLVQSGSLGHWSIYLYFAADPGEPVASARPTFLYLSAHQMDSLALDTLPPIDMLLNPAQACYLPYVQDEQEHQGLISKEDYDTQIQPFPNDVPPSAPRLAPAELPLAPQLPPRPLISLRHPTLIDLDDENYDMLDIDTDSRPDEATDANRSLQGSMTPLSTTRLSGRPKLRKLIRPSSQPKQHPDVFQSITCAPTLRHTSFEVSTLSFW